MVLSCLPAACGDESDENATNGVPDSSTVDADSAGDSDSGLRGTDTDISGLTQCGALFGLPAAQTGLTAVQCKPECQCDGTLFTPTVLSEAQLNRLAAMVLQNPPPLLEASPYDSGAIPEPPAAGQVCAVTISDSVPGEYRLDTFAGDAAATAAGAVVTHSGSCGQCSSLADLAVYMKIPDLTGPVRQCGVQGMTGGETVNMDCLKALGFTDPCAQIWYYNTVNTRTLCLSVCASLLSAPYHLPSGEINDCLQCDEDNSGPIFKAIAGRTRRNSGLPSGICRPCESVFPVSHLY